VYAVITTIGRVNLKDVLMSLRAQTYDITKIVVIDQSNNLEDNNSEGVFPVCQEYASSLNIHYIRDMGVGASRGRNIGLELLPDKGIVFFPDDDAVYDNKFIEILVLELLRGFDFCSGGIYVNHSLKRGRLPGKYKDRVLINLKNVLYTFCEAALMVNIACLRGDRFDEFLGVGSGTEAGGDEGADLVVKLLKSGASGVLNPNAKVFHPDKVAVITNKTLRRARSYAIGRGVVLRRHHLGFRVNLREFARPFMGGILFLATFNFARYKYYYNVFFGKVYGYVWMEKALLNKIN
jgi:GT2 family glycosyltransferase